MGESTARDRAIEIMTAAAIEALLAAPLRTMNYEELASASAVAAVDALLARPEMLRDLLSER